MTKKKKKNLIKNRKYLSDLNLDKYALSMNWCPGDDREAGWKKERKIYGFDSRETWGLDSTIDIFLYERLSMYNEVNCIDTSAHKFKYKKETLTFQDCIDRMLEGLEIKPTDTDYHNDKKKLKKVNSIYKIFALCNNSLWW